jgi:uncharacterized protein YbjT (DUF2867 family)
MKPAKPATKRKSLVVVFGGTGFLGRRIVNHLADLGCHVRAASRHATASSSAKSTNSATVEPFTADINDTAQVEAAIDGADAVINAVSLYREANGNTFQSIHVDGAAKIARIASKHGIKRCVLVSGIGADPKSKSPYISARGRGEGAVQTAMPTARIVRPSVMFGVDDHFLNRLCDLVSTSPVLPMFGNGNMKLQPVWVDDVAKACALLGARDTGDTISTYELGGPSVYRYRELIETIAFLRGKKVRQIPVPFVFWTFASRLGRALNADFVPDTTQIELLSCDNVVAPSSPGFEQFGIDPRSLESLVANA